MAPKRNVGCKQKVGGDGSASRVAVDVTVVRTHCTLGRERVICVRAVGFDWSSRWCDVTEKLELQK